MSKSLAMSGYRKLRSYSRGGPGISNNFDSRGTLLVLIIPEPVGGGVPPPLKQSNLLNRYQEPVIGITLPRTIRDTNRGPLFPSIYDGQDFVICEPCQGSWSLQKSRAARGVTDYL